MGELDQDDADQRVQDQDEECGNELARQPDQQRLEREYALELLIFLHSSKANENNAMQLLAGLF